MFRPSKNDISFNPKFFRDSDAYSKLIKEKVKKGYWAKGTTIENDMVHEAAHVLKFIFLNRNVNYKIRYIKKMHGIIVTKQKK